MIAQQFRTYPYKWPDHADISIMFWLIHVLKYNFRLYKMHSEIHTDNKLQYWNSLQYKEKTSGSEKGHTVRLCRLCLGSGCVIIFENQNSAVDSGTKCSAQICEFTRPQCPLLAAGRTADVAEMSSWTERAAPLTKLGSNTWLYMSWEQRV